MPSGSITVANSSVTKVLEKQQKQAETTKLPVHVVNTEYMQQKKKLRYGREQQYMVQIQPLNMTRRLILKGHCFL